MAKTVTCAFCGKEITKGMFRGDAKSLCAGGLDYITCCEDCMEKYQIKDMDEVKRFEAKYLNYKKANKIKKLSQEEMAALYRDYVEEMYYYHRRNGTVVLNNNIGFFRYNDEGCFSVAESQVIKLVAASDMRKLIDNMEKVCKCAFTGEDISRLEYRIVDKMGEDYGKMLNTAYLFEVHFNDPRVLTYKPTMLHYVMTGEALLKMNRRKKAEDSLVSVLNTIKKKTGSRARIVKIK